MNYSTCIRTHVQFLTISTIPHPNTSRTDSPASLSNLITVQCAYWKAIGTSPTSQDISNKMPFIFIDFTHSLTSALGPKHSPPATVTATVICTSTAFCIHEWLLRFGRHQNGWSLQGTSLQTRALLWHFWSPARLILRPNLICLHSCNELGHSWTIFQTM